jgi:hypothetical protein
MSLFTEEQTPVYLLGDKVSVRAEITGIVVTDSVLSFRLFNIKRELLAEHKQPLGNERISAKNPEAIDAREAWATESWRVPIKDAGFYYVVSNLRGRDGSELERSVRVAVVDALPVPTSGEFGWSLPQSDQPLGTKKLLHLLKHAGVNWVKYPAWHGEKDTKHVENIANMAEQLDQMGIQMVGMLDKPPAELTRQFDERSTPPVAVIFADEHLWLASLDSVLTNLSLKVRWWQVGGDDDVSFVGDPALPVKMSKIREQLNRFGESMQLGFVWQSTHHPPEIPNKPHSFLAFTDRPALTTQELLQFSRNTPYRSEASEWITLEPLSNEDYADDVRVRDLVQRMVAAKIRGANLACIPRPFDDQQGLFYQDGTPGELFLPWRTTALALAGRDYIGSMQLYQGSENHLFANNDEAVMVIWNDHPCQEEIYLGENLHAVNIWGTKQEIKQVKENDRIMNLLEVGPDPVFVYGIHAKLAEFCRSFQFENKQLQSLLGRDQSVRFKFQNPFPKSISGKVTVHAPALLQSAAPVYLRAGAGESRKENFQMLLKSDAGSGVRTVRLDFELNADQRHRFSIYRQINVGLEGIDVDVESRLNKAGFLEIRVVMANQTEGKVSFQCHLFTPGRRREKMQINVASDERSSITFFLPDGRDLLGKEVLLRFEELGGARIMNQSVVARE